MPFDTISHIYTTLIIVKVNALRVSMSIILSVSLASTCTLNIQCTVGRFEILVSIEHEHARPIWKHSGVK